ncbi:signal peptidase I [Alicyclobacillus cycloheptanicus]|uniref:Signal peptidase I n=1 Tax=Alicyclobacillus cycloheptanicus TaxID=1457 RepID=A0ABT9XKN7_9BACL|nr:signal peptidase I [Alicyclobacillus cycloheptanicus]MDQ0190772.1 signal peptidase I [Alicyclobacillus cycloheptanicus]WDM02739.1 signal peptidase I [Alicyclobacillus cycloheptanicus]
MVPAVIGVAIALGSHQWVAYAADVPTDSMNPTIPAPCYVVVDKLATELARPYRGEVVLFHFPDDPSQIYVKRIIGMPGDTVKVTYDHIYINGKLLSEPWPHGANEYGLGTYHVPSGHYFMMGDNRPVSFDSRFWQHPYVARSAIIGQAQYVFLPLSKLGAIQQ